MAASQIAQSVLTRAPLSTGSRSRGSSGYGRAPFASLSCPKMQSRGVKCAAMDLVAQSRSSRTVGSASSSSSSSSWMGASLWQTVAASGPPSSGKRSRGGALGTSCTVYVGGYGITPETVRWVVAAACAVLLVKRDAGAKKQFWAGILALEAPRDVLYWAKSEYGLWVAAIGLALKIFYNVPAELDYPLAVYLFLVSLPAQAVSARHTPGAKLVSVALALFVAYQYFSNTVRFSDAFKGEHLVNTLLIVVTAIACVWFFALTVL